LTTALPEGEESSSETIYSNASPDVRPPVAISPLPSTQRDPNLESMAIIELLIDEEGNVARVRLVSQPTRMQPLMLLSAAKTWTFRPALREGRPVKYRLRINLPTTNP
jgi:outer membrane biosynthesis protein TonB